MVFKGAFRSRKDCRNCCAALPTGLFAGGAAAFISAIRLPLRPRVMFGVNGFQPVESQVRVDLRGGNVGMAKQCLYSSEVGAVLDHVRGATVAQHMWTGFSRPRRCRTTDKLPDPLSSERFSRAPDEQ